MYPRCLFLQVRYAEQQVVREHVKRDYVVPADPGWPKQWSLVGVVSSLTYWFTHTEEHGRGGGKQLSETRLES